MKRIYQQPMTSAIEVQPLTVLCASADMSKGAGFITGGGE
jgi:hypothetical protein